VSRNRHCFSENSESDNTSAPPIASGSNSYQENKNMNPGKVIEVEGIRIVDSKKQVRMMLSTWSDTGDPFIQLFDGNGLPRVKVGVENSTNVHISLMYPNGRSAVTLKMAEDDRVAIGMFRENGTEVFVAEVDMNNEVQMRKGT